MEKEKATIYDYARVCKTYHTNCTNCPQFVNKDFSCQAAEKPCSDCCKEYWLAEVEE